MKIVKILLKIAVIVVCVYSMFLAIIGGEKEKTPLLDLYPAQIEYAEILPRIELTAPGYLTVKERIRIQGKNLTKLIVKEIQDGESGLKPKQIITVKWISNKQFRIAFIVKKKNAVYYRITFHLNYDVASYHPLKNEEDIFTAGGHNSIESEVLYFVLSKVIKDNGVQWVNAYQKCWDLTDKKELVFVGCQEEDLL